VKNGDDGKSLIHHTLIHQEAKYLYYIRQNSRTNLKLG
jgi:hypothetical protein